MSAWTCHHADGKADRKIVPPRSRIPYWKCLSAESEEKHEPVSDIDTKAVDRLNTLDPNRPIREADIASKDETAGGPSPVRRISPNAKIKALQSLLISSRITMSAMR